MQDTILELCVDVFLLHIAHVETARAGAGKEFAPQIAALLILFIVAVAMMASGSARYAKL